jgi:hypothetical protein
LVKVTGLGGHFEPGEKSQFCVEISRQNGSKTTNGQVPKEHKNRQARHAPKIFW